MLSHKDVINILNTEKAATAEGVAKAIVSVTGSGTQLPRTLSSVGPRQRALKKLRIGCANCERSFRRARSTTKQKIWLGTVVAQLASLPT